MRIRAVSPEPPLLAHTSGELRGTFRQKARSLAPLNGWACAVKIDHDGNLEDTNSLDGAQTETFLINLISVLLLILRKSPSSETMRCTKSRATLNKIHVKSTWTVSSVRNFVFEETIFLIIPNVLMLEL